jgi:hypothetical protein
MSEAAATTTATTEPAAAGATATTSAATTSAPDLSWLGDGAKPEVQQYVQGKGFKSAAALAEAYQNAEKALSSRSFEPPKPEDAAGWAKIKAAMGVPEAPDKYDLGEAGKALKPEALQQWSPVFHQLGLSNEQASKLIATTTEMATKAQEAQHEAFVKQSEAAAERLKLEHGDKWPAFHDIASRGFNLIKQQLKMDDAKIDALERALGTREMLSLAHMIGEAKVEAGFVASDGQHRAMTKDQARQAIAGFKGNPEKSAALLRSDHPNHAAVLSEWTQLRRIAEG